MNVYMKVTDRNSLQSTDDEFVTQNYLPIWKLIHTAYVCIDSSVNIGLRVLEIKRPVEVL